MKETYKFILLLFALAFYQLSISFSGFALQILSSIFLAAAIALLCKFIVEIKETSDLFIIFLLLTVGVFFRHQIFFYWDEWVILERYRASGLSAIFNRHNEHFQPLFSFFYFTETILFKDKYLLYLIPLFLIHATNAILLSKIIFKICDNKKTANFLALLFLLSSQHAGVLHWPLLIAIAMSRTVMFLAILYAFDYLEWEKKNKIILASLSLLSAPFFFANGFSILPEIILLFFLFPKADLKRALFFITVQITIIILVLLSYLILANTNSGKNFFDTIALENIPDKLSYLFIASQLGTVFRGLGFLPSLRLTIPVRELPPWFWEIIKPTEPIFFFSFLGLTTSLIILGLSLYLAREKKSAFLFWLIGQLLILSSLFLPALGRADIKIEQGMSIRYQYYAQIGLLIMLIPIANHLFSKGKTKLISAIFFFYLSSHLTLNATYKDFTSKGQIMRDAVTRIKARKSLPAKANISLPPGYRNRNKVIGTLKWLKVREINFLPG